MDKASLDLGGEELAFRGGDGESVCSAGGLAKGLNVVGRVEIVQQNRRVGGGGRRQHYFLRHAGSDTDASRSSFTRKIIFEFCKFPPKPASSRKYLVSLLEPATGGLEMASARWQSFCQQGWRVS